MIVSCARALLWLLLPTDTRAIIVRDLDDEYRPLHFSVTDSRPRDRVVLPTGRRLHRAGPADALQAAAGSRRSVALALDGIVRDIRLAIRLAVRQKSFTLAVLVTLWSRHRCHHGSCQRCRSSARSTAAVQDPSELVRVWSANP